LSSTGHDQVAINWACIASLIETAKLHGIDPKPYLADILTKLVNGWPMAKVDELLPGAWARQTKSALRPDRMLHQFGGSASETSCASLASA
jgi:hypothetical protein